jgi:FkbM family methyltransferase
MGHLVEKYTDAYFLRANEQGEILPYGVEGIESFIKGELREHDREILEHVKFAGANVLEFGFGRGETIKYAWEQGVRSYIGVDFSQAACRIAQEFLDKFSISGPEIVNSDAVEFVRGYSRKYQEGQQKSLDIVMMLDFIEHVPRVEVSEILALLRPCLSDTAVIVVNTPDFLFDNDVISEGLNEQGKDSSDFIEETQGMHCNRYTLESLRNFFAGLGYQAISRGHYFVLSTGDDNDWTGEGGYSQCWNEAYKRGCLLKNEWPRENFESAYQQVAKPELHKFKEGNLNGIALYSTNSYLEYYQNGNYDDFLTNYIAQHDLIGKVVFDLGSFVGANSLQFSRMVGTQGTVCAFEPNPFNRDRLRLNISENPDIGDRIRVFPFAVSDAPGTTNFRIHRDVDAGISSASFMDGAHTTLPEETLDTLGFTEVEVDVCTIDEFVERTGLVPCCMKIDIEGAEHLALFGAMKTLEAYHPILLIELHSIFCTAQVFNTLAKLGYAIELLHVEPDGRCFIGASSNPSLLQNRTMALGSALQQSAQIDTLRLEMSQLRKKSEALAVTNKALVVEINAAREENFSLEQNLKNSRNEVDILKRQQADLLATADSLQASLLRYQMLPIIRLARKVRRMLGQGH